ncbi:MAG: TetR/AcrR family transcriptional regulator [Alphaproteobacteria bacterium]|nr:MAG: TetR/AcrR family transcriptional regulator [Alphaproteobacteria bacterium]
MAGKVKTRDRVLMTSLDLFNEEGEPNVTTVDIANEMDISPGNLYYHFKGKDVIISALYEEFDQRIREVLQAPVDKPLALEDNWYYLYVVFEEIYAFRFFYRNLTDILTRDATIEAKFRRILDLKRKSITAIALALRDAEVIDARDHEIHSVTESIVLILTYWLTYQELTHRGASDARIIHTGVFQIMSALAPYFGEGQRDFVETCLNMLNEALANS